MQLLYPAVVVAITSAGLSSFDDCLVCSAEFGARCDGVTEDTLAVQKALDTCPPAGRRIVFQAGRTCLSRPLAVRSHTSLLFEDGSVLKAGEKWNDTAFVSATSAVNVTVSGNGTIDGSGKQWWTGNNKTPNRPPMLVLFNCTHVQLTDITLLNPAAWCAAFNGAHYRVYGVTVRAPNYLIAPNTDGFDVSASDVHIRDCDITNGDDSIVIKSPATNVLVEDSVVRQGNGLVIGTSANAYFRNITFRNCRAERTLFGCHIKFKDSQSGSVSGVRFEGIEIIDPVSYAIGINQHGQSYDTDTAADATTMTSDAGSAAPSAAVASSAGGPAGPPAPALRGLGSNVSITNVTFCNITGRAARVGVFTCSAGPLACTDINLWHVHIAPTRPTVLPSGCTFSNVRGFGDDVTPTTCIPPAATRSRLARDPAPAPH